MVFPNRNGFTPTINCVRFLLPPARGPSIQACVNQDAMQTRVYQRSNTLSKWMLVPVLRFPSPKIYRAIFLAPSQPPPPGKIITSILSFSLHHFTLKTNKHQRPSDNMSYERQNSPSPPVLETDEPRTQGDDNKNDASSSKQPPTGYKGYKRPIIVYLQLSLFNCSYSAPICV